MARENLGPDDLGIDPGTEPGVYRWFLASLLFGRRIRQEQAEKTYHALIDHGLTSPKHIADLGREQLRRVLDEGGYGRFDYLMSDELHEVMARVLEQYGSVHRLVATAADRAAAHDRLIELKGVGEVTARIFLDAVPSGMYASG